MKKFVKQVSDLFSNREETAQVRCNYANNYYGDQVCQLVKNQPGR